MIIRNDRDQLDSVNLDLLYWSGIRQGNDGYPPNFRFANNFIGGGVNENFKATAIEVFGIKMQS